MADEKKRPPKSAKELLERYEAGERDFEGARLADANLGNANLSNANLSNANLSGANLNGANLSNANLHGANLFGAHLSEANLREANLHGANLSRAYLRGANLSEANLSGAHLRGAYLREANLNGADLSGAHLRNADLSEADLSEANLSHVDLSRANLTEANLLEADFTRACLHNVTLGPLSLTTSTIKATVQRPGAKGLTQEQIDSAYGNQYTMLPNNLSRPSSWLREQSEPNADDEPHIIIRFKGHAEPKTLQALSREMAGWTETVSNLASFQKCDPILPIVDIRRGSLVFWLQATPAFIVAIGTVWMAILKTKEHLEGRELRSKDIDKITSRVVEQLESKESADRIRSAVENLSKFNSDGGDMDFDMPERILEEYPYLRKILAWKTEISSTAVKDREDQGQ
ncbi:MAG: pentapeptide repeat-containing protein [Proteobacteria bacterium]|nr:pentapeptide repeat-containing protein [Pseudomonadota bacterium]